MNTILDYRHWTGIYEALGWDVTEKEPVAGTNHKVKVKYIDANTIKVKAVNDYDMVKPDGTLDPNLPGAIVAFLKTHDGTDFARQYPQLQNIDTFYKDNFFVYNVMKENDRRQVVVFSLQKRANFKNIPPTVKALSYGQAMSLAQAPEVKTILGSANTALAQSTDVSAQQPAATQPGQVKITQGVAFDNLSSLTPANPVYQLVYRTVAGLSVANALSSHKEANDLLDKSVSELEGRAIGKDTILLIKALIAGLGISKWTNELGKVKDRTMINQFVADKLAALTSPTKETPASAQNSSSAFYLGPDGYSIFEQEEDGKLADKATLPADFNMDAFLAVVKGATPSTDTRDIKVPDGGFKFVGNKGARVEEFKKVQRLILDKFAGTRLANDQRYIKLKNAGTTGVYGPITRALVEVIKQILELKDQNPEVVTAEFINALQTREITESYILPNGVLFEQVNWEKYQPQPTKQSSTPVGTQSKPAAKTELTAEAPAPVAAVDEKMLTEIDNLFLELAKKIKTFLENEESFSAYKGEWYANDKEEEAWDDVMVSQMKKWSKYINDVIVPKIKAIEKGDPGNYERYVKTLSSFSKMLEGDENKYIGAGYPLPPDKWEFKNAFTSADDEYELLLYLNSGTKKIILPTDF